MSRHDLFWLAIKVAGLYLVVEGVEGMPLAVADGGLQNQLGCYVPLVVGGILLGIRHRAEGGALDGSRVTPVPVVGIGRDDCFWVACKVLGLWIVMRNLAYLPSTIASVWGWSGKGSSVWLGLVVQLAAGLWLVFSNVLPNVVARRGGRVVREGGASAE